MENINQQHKQSQQEIDKIVKFPVKFRKFNHIMNSLLCIIEKVAEGETHEKIVALESALHDMSYYDTLELVKSYFKNVSKHQEYVVDSDPCIFQTEYPHSLYLVDGINFKICSLITDYEKTEKIWKYLKSLCILSASIVKEIDEDFHQELENSKKQLAEMLTNLKLKKLINEKVAELEKTPLTGKEPTNEDEEKELKDKKELEAHEHCAHEQQGANTETPTKHEHAHSIQDDENLNKILGTGKLSGIIKDIVNDLPTEIKELGNSVGADTGGGIQVDKIMQLVGNKKLIGNLVGKVIGKLNEIKTTGISPDDLYNEAQSMSANLSKELHIPPLTELLNGGLLGGGLLGGGLDKIIGNPAIQHTLENIAKMDDNDEKLKNIQGIISTLSSLIGSGGQTEDERNSPVQINNSPSLTTTTTTFVGGATDIISQTIEGQNASAQYTKPKHKKHKH